MEKLVIEGGIPLQGEVKISGAKNAALPLMAATLLCAGKHILRNIPDLRDTRTLTRLLENLGAVVERKGDSLHIDTTVLEHGEASYQLVKTMRASVLVLGPLLARLGKTRVSLPGGCAIGERPVNFHTDGLRQLGAVCTIKEGYIEAEAEILHGTTIYFDIPSVTGTENLLMAATLAKGTTVLKNAAREPEIGNLVDMLNAMGAKISGRGTDVLTIEGVAALHPADCRIIADRIEAGTYLLAIAATGGSGRVTGCCPADLPSLVEKLRHAGLEITEEADALAVSWPGPHRTLSGVDIKTAPFPGYPTDLQAQFMALMTLCDGQSTVHETIFENRFMHVAELRRMGAKIKVDGRFATVSGQGMTGLKGAPVMATDLRASSSLVIAGLAASGRTDISRIYHLERGYENLVGKLTGLGARVWKEQE